MLLHHTTALLLTIIYPSALTFTCYQDETVGSWTVRSGTEISLTHQVFKSFSQMPQMFEFTKSKKIVSPPPHAKWLKMCFIKTSLATIQKLLQRSSNRNIFLFFPQKILLSLSLPCLQLWLPQSAEKQTALVFHPSLLCSSSSADLTMFRLNSSPSENRINLPLSSVLHHHFMTLYESFSGRKFPAPAAGTLALGESLSELFGLNT